MRGIHFLASRSHRTRESRDRRSCQEPPKRAEVGARGTAAWRGPWSSTWRTRMGEMGTAGPRGAERRESERASEPRPRAGRGLGGAGRSAGLTASHCRFSRSMKSPAVVGVLCTDSQGLNLGCEYRNAAGPGLRSGMGLGIPTEPPGPPTLPPGSFTLPPGTPRASGRSHGLHRCQTPCSGGAGWSREFDLDNPRGPLPAWDIVWF